MKKPFKRKNPIIIGSPYTNKWWGNDDFQKQNQLLNEIKIKKGKGLL